MSGSIPREFSLKKAVLSGIALFASLMMLLALCYTLIVGEKSVYIYGYSFVEVVTENGFTMLKFSSELITSSFQWGAIVIGLLCLLQLLVSLALIVGNVLSFLLLPQKTNKIIAMVSVIVSTVFSFFYMLEGAIFATICSSTMSGTFITFAYIPLIFAILITVAYFVCSALVKEKEAAQETAQGAYQYGPMTKEPTGQPAAGSAFAAQEEETSGSARERMSPEKADMLLMNFKILFPRRKSPHSAMRWGRQAQIATPISAWRRSKIR